MTAINTLDAAVLAWFAACWVGYTFFADHIKREGHTLLTVMRDKREMWMRRMLSRENRIVDTTITATLMRSVSLFASTTIFILAGLIAILGAVDKARALVQEIPFAETATQTQWEIKILLLLVIFIYAFFKFAWALRQFNYAIVLIGSAPPPEEAETENALIHARESAEVITLAVLNFNRGLRAYYFGLATLSWFIHPVLFAISTMWVVGVLYRREFMSKTLQHLSRVPVANLKD